MEAGEAVARNPYRTVIKIGRAIRNTFVVLLALAALAAVVGLAVASIIQGIFWEILGSLGIALVAVAAIIAIGVFCAWVHDKIFRAARRWDNERLTK